VVIVRSKVLVVRSKVLVAVDRRKVQDRKVPVVVQLKALVVVARNSPPTLGPRRSRSRMVVIGDVRSVAFKSLVHGMTTVACTGYWARESTATTRCEPGPAFGTSMLSVASPSASL
jgi:hypothetical protein